MDQFSIPNMLSKVGLAQLFGAMTDPRGRLQMNHLDKDIRYMSVSDLAEELKKDTFKLDATSEGKVVGT